MSEHSKDKDYKVEYDFLSLIVEQGLVTDREREQFVVLEDKGALRWFWKAGDDYN